MSQPTFCFTNVVKRRLPILTLGGPFRCVIDSCSVICGFTGVLVVVCLWLDLGAVLTVDVLSPCVYAFVLSAIFCFYCVSLLYWGFCVVTDSLSFLLIFLSLSACSL